MALESADSPELAMTLEQYAKFLDSHDRSTEAAPIQDRATTIRKILVAALSPKMTLEASPIKMGPGMTAPSLLRKVEPEYSEEERSFKIAGTVLLKMVVDVDGIAKNIELSKGMGYGLDEKARRPSGSGDSSSARRAASPSLSRRASRSTSDCCRLLCTGKIRGPARGRFFLLLCSAR